MVPSVQAKLYRWVDDYGNTIFSDKIPPKHAKYKRESLNESARVIEVKEAAKTKEQFAIEKRLEKLRKEQEKIIAQQKSQDKVLLSTFRTENDLHRTLKGKLRAIDAQQKVSQGNLLRLDKQLLLQKKKAVAYERNGNKTPKLIIDEIQATETQIQLVRQEIYRQNDKKQQVEQTFAVDIERFVFLTQSGQESVQLSNTSAELSAANKLGLFTCKNETQCATAWAIASTFVQNNSTTNIDVDSSKLIMTSPPKADNDISLSVSKISMGNKKIQFFLDIRCRKSSLGTELCESQKIQDLRTAFKPYIESALTVN